MPELTPKLGIKKPLGNETVARAAFNENYDIIDAQAQKNIAQGATAPTSPAINDLWIDTSASPHSLKKWTGTVWVKVGAVTWDDISGKPTSFTPSAHKSTHAAGGTDVLTPGDIQAQKNIAQGATAPASPAEGDLWIDTSTSPNALKRYTAGNWVKIGAVTPGDIGAVANAGNAPSIQAGPDASKPAPGTAGRLYVATDTQIIYRDIGTAWQKVGVVKWRDIDDKPASFTPAIHGNEVHDPDLALASDLTAHLADTVQVHKVHFGSANFAGPAGVTITHNLGHTNYKAMITPTADPNGFLGEIWIVKAANTIVVYNSGSAMTSFDWQIAEVTP